MYRGVSHTATKRSPRMHSPYTEQRSECTPLPHQTFTFQNPHSGKHPQFKVSICKTTGQSSVFQDTERFAMSALLTLTGQNTPASFSFRSTFFYTRYPSFPEDLLYAVPFNSNICGHSVADVSVCDNQVSWCKCSSQKKYQRLDF